MIILELEVASVVFDGEEARFRGVGVAEGFSLVMPLREAEALGYPDRVHFVVSERPLVVSMSGNSVREAGE
jgi:hypothetical protein